MPIVAIVEFHIAAERVPDARDLFDGMLAQTRAFEGANRIDWLIDRDDPASWTLYEQWATPEAEQAYRDYRMADGAVPELGGMLDRPPVLRRFDPAATRSVRDPG
jgi:quinol monooxygenase YgiN